MDLSTFSHNITLAKSDNARWIRHAEDLIKEREASKEAFPTYRDKCVACQWLYDHGDEISALYKKRENSEIDLFHFDIMEQVEVLRYDLHEKYLQIFKIYDPEQNRGFFASLFNKSRRVSERDRRNAEKLYGEMQQIVEELESKLEHLERSLGELCRLNSA